MKSILIVDADSSFSFQVSEALKREFEIRVVSHHVEAISALQAKTPQILLLGVRSENDELFQFIQETHHIRPEIRILLTAPAPSKALLIRCLNARVDGFVEQPFSVLDLQALIDRGTGPHASDEIQIDFFRRSVLLGNEAIPLTRTEFSLLLLFRGKPGVFLSRAEIEGEIWPASTVARNNLDTHLSRLRAKIPLLKDKLLCLRGEGFVYTPTGAGSELGPRLQKRK